MTIRELPLRPFQIALGVILLSAWTVSEWRQRTGKPAWPRPAGLERLSALAEAHYRAGLAAIVGGFALAATLVKCGQLRALELNATDFWLFEDMLAQMSRGGFFLTRYAPQATGWVQHGSVHEYFSFAVALPLVWIAGPLSAALLYGPLALAGGGAALAALARPRWGALGGWLAAAALLGSSQVARILMYDVHPEAAYPLYTLLWAWAAGWGDGRVRPKSLLAATVLLMGLKADSFLVLPPLLLATAWLGPHPRRGWLAVSAALTAAGTVFHFYAISKYVSGAWGPQAWDGLPVVIPRGPDLLGGRHWDGPASAIGILRDIAERRGGFGTLVLGLPRLLLSRPWLTLLIVAPWVAIQPAYWVSILPIAFVDSMLEDPGKFINYYSAPVLGIFWLAAVRARPRSFAVPLWMFCASLVLGGSGLTYPLISPAADGAREEARQLVSCLPTRGQGMVSGRFLGLVPRDRVAAARPAPSGDGSLTFLLFSTKLPSYELPQPQALALETRLRSDPRWSSLDPDCRPRDSSANAWAILFVRK